MTLAELRAAARTAGDPSVLARAIPYGERIGLGVEMSDGGLIGRLRYSDELIGNPALPAIHGGAIGSLLESTAIFQLIWEAEPAVLPKTISITIDFLRTGRPVDTLAQGIVTRQGRRVANVRVEAWQDDRHRPIAIAHGHFLLTAAEPA